MQSRLNTDFSIQSVFSGKETYAKLSGAREANNICKHFSSCKRDIEQLKETLKTGDKSDINTHMSTGETPLLCAILKQDYEVIPLLLHYGADVKKAGAYYDGVVYVNRTKTYISRWISPAQAAVDCEDVAIADAVLEKISEGFEVDAAKWRKLCEEAMRQPDNMFVGLAKQLVTSFTPLRNNLRNSSERDCYGRVLLVAAELGLCNIAEHLLLHNADPNYYYEHRTPLVAAAINGHIDMCQLLVQHGAQVNSEASACDALVMAVGYGSVDAMETLLSLGCQYKRGVLLNPICSYLNKVLEKNEGEDDEDYNNRRRDAKQKAKDSDHLIEDGTLLHLAVLTKSVPVVSCLLKQYGAQDLLTIINSSGNSALEVAAMQIDAAMIDTLLTHIHAAGIDTTQFMSGRNDDNKSALLCGLQAKRNCCKSCDELWRYKDEALAELIKVFLKWHVDFRLESEESCIAALGVAIACNKMDLVPRMVERHFDVQKYINMCCFTNDLTPLELAIKCENAKIVRSIIGLGADVNGGKSILSTSPLFYIVTNNFSPKWVFKVFDILTKAGVNWNVVSNYYGSVLHAALCPRDKKKENSWYHDLNIDIIKYCVNKCGHLVNTPGQASLLEYIADKERNIEFRKKFILTELLVTAGAHLVPSALQRFAFAQRRICHCSESAAELLFIAGCEVVPTLKTINRAIKRRRWWLLKMLLSCADSATVALSPYVAGELSLPDNQNAVIRALHNFAENPPSLSHLARRVVRQQLSVHTGGASIIPTVFQLHYPPSLQQYLLLSDSRRCDIDASPPHRYSYDITCSFCAKHCKDKTKVQCMHACMMLNRGGTDEEGHESDTSDMDVAVDNWGNDDDESDAEHNDEDEQLDDSDEESIDAFNDANIRAAMANFFNFIHHL